MSAEFNIARFRKRPVVVEAVQWTGGNEDALKAFTEGRFNCAPEPFTTGNTAEVYDVLHQTWVGVYTGQWVINEEVLAETYERIGDVSE